MHHLAVHAHPTPPLVFRFPGQSFPGGPVARCHSPSSHTPRTDKAHRQEQHPAASNMTVRNTGSLLVGLLLLCHTWRAWATVEVNMEDRVEVNLGEKAQIACRFTTEEGIGGTTIQWFYVTQKGEEQEIYHYDSALSKVVRGTPFTDRINVNGTGVPGEVVLTIENVRLEDELEFVCLVQSLTDGTAKGRTKLRVFQTPGHPTIEGVITGISIQESTPSKIGTCEVKNGYPKPNITWYKDTTPIRIIDGDVNVEPSSTRESSGLYSVKSELSMKVVKEDADIFFHCEITYFVPGETRMVETSPINITVLYPHTSLNIWVESPKGKLKEGDTMKIHCSGNGNSASSFAITAGENITSDSNVLVKENVTRFDSGVYLCSAMDMESFEEVTGTTTVFVHYLDNVVIEPKNTIVVHKGEEVNATCNALSSLSTQATWFKNGDVVSEGHTLVLKDTTFDTSGTYSCVVTVPEVGGMETSGTLRVHIQGSPEIQPPVSTELEESLDRTVNLSCLVRGFPVPTVTWSTSDEEILQTTSEKEIDYYGVHSVLSVRVTGDITVFCNATNNFSEDSVAFHIKAILHTTPANTDSPVLHTTPANTDSPVLHTTPANTDSPVKPETAIPPKKVKKEGSGVIIAVLIVCILLLAILGSVLYFLYKKGKICGRSGKQDLTKGKSNKDNIVVEMKSDNTEEAVLLGVNGEKQPPNDQ